MRILLLHLAVGVLISCNPNDADLLKLQRENDSLHTILNQNDSLRNTIITTYGDIEFNLTLIETKKTHINNLALKGKLSKDDKEIILMEMDSINLLLGINKEIVYLLENSIPEEEAKKAGLSHIIQGMTAKNNAEDEGLIDLKKDLVQISSDFSDLFEDYIYQEAENLEMKEKLSSASSELKSAQEKLESTKEKLYTAWYVLGSKDELKSKGIIYSSGFLSNKEVNEDFDKSLFRKINILDFKELLLEGKKIDIVTTHPTESYSLQVIKKKVDRLLITNPEKFWSVSKFLIIEIE